MHGPGLEPLSERARTALSLILLAALTPRPAGSA